MKSNAYSALAPYYEKLITSCDYEQWSQYVYNKVIKYAPTKNGCDVACGSGYFTRFMKKSGLNVYGVDSSEEMLAEANSLSIKEKIPVKYILQDMKRFKAFEKLGFITVINDGVNYLSQKELKTTLKAFHSNLVKGGILLFDISSQYKLQQIIGNNLFCEDDDNVTYIWFNTLYEDRVKMELTFFSKEGDLYRRTDESHVQYIHKTEEIETMLSDVGFEIVEKSGFLGQALIEQSERINFIVMKK